ncbi:integral membrane protein [Colletotrichum tofieldiae]|uniref:Integral membrane protein n=2 Tax=Colletotrichum spaethianum species complex TaxID=2707349 RepID=A0A161WHJ6_9PEZI|nr:integral membrane protein [Colletotrichum tofieldiae]GJC77167.1 satratoxin biosynthesis SC1 cluster protein 4 [Colletotrichum liriopes]GKT56169.1 integral membrane protein [Colletotrichum tofieldiae]GKT81529.1 integral membrane protein [Colletotrichum tofieldiae]GKT82153.1 integral membrane protein [Colletotrichum tofieldiae]
MTETQSPTVITVALVFAVLTFIVIALRVWARAILVRSFGPDDVFIIFAALLSWAFIAVTIRATHLGLGSHIGPVMDLGTDNFVMYLQTVWLSSIFYNACLGFVKISALALYMRLGDSTLRRLAAVMLGVVGCQAGANVLVCIFQCSPVQAAYDITILAAEKKCIDVNAFYLANAAVNILTDLLTYTLPIPLVIKLQVPKQQKVGLGVILCLGLFACISSVIRITFIPDMLINEDATWAISKPMYWSVIETNIGILAASIPSMKVIAKRYAPRLLGTSSNGHGSTSGGRQSGFRMMSSSNTKKNRSTSDKTATALHSLSKGGFDTKIGRGNADNSSEEALNYPPSGKIGVHTHVSMQYDEGSDVRENKEPFQRRSGY